ncbi:MAG: hypothetical protein JO243_23305 [Solirubrobacterales bacterium]|nr:hypothetical protein [Solirubrobacterales bacterium]
MLLGMLLAALAQTIVPAAMPTIVGNLRGASHLSRRMRTPSSPPDCKSS